MSWWGKVIGGAFGFMLGGPLGAVLGAALGHKFDQGLSGHRVGVGGGGGDVLQHKVQMAFFTATFSVMGRIAKADGRVSPEEIRLAEVVMRQMELQEDQRRLARELFHQGKDPSFPLDGVLAQFRTICRRHLNLFRVFIEIQIEAALADGHLHAAEEQLLRDVAVRLGFAAADFEQLLNLARSRTADGRAGVGSRSEPVHDLAEDYKLLGVSEQADDDEVKRAYRRMMNQYHPDKLVSKGLPEEMMNYATSMTRSIKAAHERIKKARGTARGSH